MVALPSSSRFALCLCSAALVLAQDAAAATTECASPGDLEADIVVLGDEMALLHGAGSHPHTSTVRKRSAALENEVVFVQEAVHVNATGSVDSVSAVADAAISSESSSLPPASTVSMVLGADASIMELAPASAGAVQDAAQGSDSEGFESWLQESDAEAFPELAALAAAADETAVKVGTKETPAAAVAAKEVLAGQVPAANGVATAPGGLEGGSFLSFASRSKGALESFSYEIGLHIPVTLSLIILVAAVSMMVLSTLKNWAGLMFNAPAEGPPPLERPNPLQALRVLQLNLDNIGQAKAKANLSAKPNVNIADERTTTEYDAS